MESLWLALYWGSPIGIGIFLLCLGGIIYLLTKADEISKRTKAMVKEKGLEKKIELVEEINVALSLNGDGEKY